ncbi:MAG TPA: hypothetical protein VFF30_18385 [Nitrososphaerales archaeon]|nr:hypothetical protein [Nitrososphaerales archaeon]
MRLGTLSNLTLLKWNPTDQRDAFIMTVPGALSAYTFDMASSQMAIVIDGILYDTSNANLASDMEYLESLFRTGQLVWLDATDQFPSLCAFGKVAKMQGPTVDASLGQYAVKYTFEFWPVLPWGTMLFNPWKQTGFKLRDIDGTGQEYMLDPTKMDCNYSIDSTNKIVSWEFIVENQNAFSGNQLIINSCDATTHFAGVSGSGFTVSNDTVIHKEGTGSLKLAGTSTAGGLLSVSYTPTSAINLSSPVQDFLVLWVRSDFGGNSTGTMTIQIGNSGLTAYYQWAYSNLTANIWYRLVIPLRAPNGTTGSPSLASIAELLVQSTGKTSASTHLWVDEIAADVGMWAQIECMIPDNVLQEGAGTAINVYNWHSGSYTPVMSINVYGNIQGGGDSQEYFLDGSGDYNVYGVYTATMWPPGQIGTTVSPAAVFGYENIRLTYTSTYGPNNRLALSFKMSPATSDSVSGNYPSDDLSGFQAINKMRIKVQINYTNEDTTYNAFNAL